MDFRLEAEAAFLELVEACRVADDKSPSTKAANIGIQKSATPQGLQSDNKDQQPAEPLVLFKQKFKAHIKWNYSVAVSPDGEWLVSCSKDKTVKLWSMDTGANLATLKGHTDEVNCVGFTTDSNCIISSSDDQTLRIWDRQTGCVKHILKGHSGRVFPVVVLADGKRLLSGAVDDDESIKLWNIKTGACLKTIKTEHTIRAATVNVNGTRTVIGGHDGKLTLWDLESAECLVRLNGHSDVVCSVQMTADQQFAVSGSRDKTVKIWNLATASCVASLEASKGSPFSRPIPG